MTQPYKTKSGATQFKPSLAWIEGVCRSDNSTGFCLACASEQGGCEPDARHYECESCGEQKVYGAEELAMMQLYHEGDDAP